MAKEIERKFLVTDNSFKDLAINTIEISQGYLSVDADRTVRVRIYGDSAFLTVKTRNVGAIRNEWEYEIPLVDAQHMLDAAAINRLSKTRFIVPANDGLFWEVDCFHGNLEGLVVAEIELPRENTFFVKPSFIGREVTGDPFYYNSNLATQA